MAEDFSDILMGHEKLVWSGKPDWSRAANTSRLGQRVRATLAFVIFTVCFFALLIAGVVIPLDGFPGMLAILGMIVCVVCALIAIGVGYNAIDRERASEQYLLTSHRLIVIDHTHNTQSGIMRGHVAVMHSHANGEVFDVLVGVQSVVDAELHTDWLTLHAIDNGPDLQKLITETLMPENGASR